ncbi:hypothetical protein [Marnyiella aurantia]|nr:hypothetical protein [Marnyiella aurantia]
MTSIWRKEESGKASDGVGRDPFGMTEGVGYEFKFNSVRSV